MKKEMDGGWFKPIEELTFADDFMFGKVMENKEICKEVLEILLGIKIGDIQYPKLQEVLNPCYDKKSIRLDVFAEDSDRVFDIEIQMASHKSLPLRMRYYQSLMDVDSLLKGDAYKNLKESYVIFICMFDPFGKGKPKYTFRNICEEENEIIFSDKTHKMFYTAHCASAVSMKISLRKTREACYNVNGTDKKISPKLKAFLKYVKTKSATDNFTEKLDAMVEKIKHTNKHRREYLTYQVHINDWKEEGRLVGLQQGIAQGEHKKAIETARNLLTLGVATPEQIAQATGLPLAEVQQLAN